MKCNNCIYFLVEKNVKVSEMCPRFFVNYFRNGYALYYSKEEAEQGRQRGDAYDEIGKTRVVGFRLEPFIPKKQKKGE